MSKHILLYLFGLLLLASCKKESVPTTATTTTETVGKVVVQNLDFNYLSSKGQVSVSDKGNDLSSGVSLRMKKDSVIWVSVLPGLGIEAARMKLTQDSVYLMNRLQKEYFATDYSYLSNRFNIDVNFEVVQAIILGNYQVTGTEKVVIEAQQQHIQQLREKLLFDYFIGSQQQKVQQLNVKDNSTGNSIAVRYEDFQPVGVVPFAHNMAAQVVQKGQLSSFKLNHNKVAITDKELSFPFNVPADYKRITFN